MIESILFALIQDVFPQQTDTVAKESITRKHFFFEQQEEAAILPPLTASQPTCLLVHFMRWAIFGKKHTWLLAILKRACLIQRKDDIIK